jgi:hypothetical protein
MFIPRGSGQLRWQSGHLQAKTGKRPKSAPVFARFRPLFAAQACYKYSMFRTAQWWSRGAALRPRRGAGPWLRQRLARLPLPVRLWRWADEVLAKILDRSTRGYV